MILVFGQTGQVARELQRLAPTARFLAREDADLGNPDACAAAVLAARPEAVINAAAFTGVDRAETEQTLAMRVNGEAPGAMARACAQIEIPFVHISSDYVFDGQGTQPFAPEAATAPLGAYGRSKAQGEALVRQNGAVHTILRTSWVFSAHGQNFVKTMLRLGETRERIAVVDDQVGGPTPAAAIAQAALHIAATLRTEPAKSGTYHFAGTPEVSWAGFARAIFAAACKDVTVDAIATADYPTPAARPANSRLDCTSLAAFDLARPDWRAALVDVVRELEGQ